MSHLQPEREKVVWDSDSYRQGSGIYNYIKLYIIIYIIIQVILLFVSLNINFANLIIIAGILN